MSMYGAAPPLFDVSITDRPRTAENHTIELQQTGRFQNAGCPHQTYLKSREGSAVHFFSDIRRQVSDSPHIVFLQGFQEKREIENIPAHRSDFVLNSDESKLALVE